MHLWTIVLRNIRQRSLSSTLTAASIALGVAVVVAVLALKDQSQQGFRQSAVPYDLVVGAKGSRLQLVLNTLFHMDRSAGNVPFKLYQSLKGDRRVKAAVPVSVGDVYKGHRIVGTTDAFFTQFEVRKDVPFALSEGRFFKVDEEHLEHVLMAPADHAHEGEEAVFEAVLGARAAASTGLRVGGSLKAQHGGDFGEEHEETWKVVGVLAPTGTAHDRAVFINLESFYHIAGHTKEAATRGMVSAVLLRTRGDRAADDLEYELNQGTAAMAVPPAEVVLELFDLIGKVDVLLLAVSALVIVVAAVSILVSIYNSMAERRRAIAIMRALGARRTQILSIVVFEAAALCLFGGVAGLVLGHLLTAVAAGVLASEAGIVVSPLAVQAVEGLVLVGVVVLGGISGLVPALRAYRTDIADGLSPTN